MLKGFGHIETRIHSESNLSEEKTVLAQVQREPKKKSINCPTEADSISRCLKRNEDISERIVCLSRSAWGRWHWGSKHRECHPSNSALLRTPCNQVSSVGAVLTSSIWGSGKDFPIM
mmetsp:Transcript_12670/g.20648  ORF Transcript_12670/g.20648 Transcript_12670/m.20648 type:complete len:117 (-) Transcript_12670:864-1214(-)